MMTNRLVVGLFAALVLILVTAPTRAAETWSCTYAGFGDPSYKVRASYKVTGSHLEGWFLDDHKIAPTYSILENSKTAIVAADGGSVDTVEHGLLIGGTILIIKKDTGEFVLGNVAWHARVRNESTTGTCKRDNAKQW